MILAGDIGGTHTRLALFADGRIVVEEKFSSEKYAGLEEIAREFLSEKNYAIKKACFGIAGPVRDGVCRATNLPWIVDAASLAKGLGIAKVILMNDLEANAYGLKMLKKEELLCLHPGIKQLGNQALIAAGTGLGEAGLYWDGKDHHPFGCEGGHVDFAPRDELEIELLRFAMKKFGHVSYERFVSGPGIYLLYQFLVAGKHFPPTPEVEAAMQKKDPSGVITEWGTKHQDPLCMKVIDMFLSLYGAEAGNLALKILPFVGFFIGGGIVPRLVEKVKEGAFVKAFFNKGRFKKLLETIPIWIVLNDDAALLGAVYSAERA